MSGFEDLLRVSDSVDSSEERTIEPSSSLADELRERVWHICLADRRLDVAQYPMDCSEKGHI